MYCTLEDILYAFAEKDIAAMSQDDIPLDEVDQAVIDASITQACGLIDAYIGGRYIVPLISAPVTIQRIAIDIAVYYIAKRRYISEFPEALKIGYDEAIAYLIAIRDGLQLLDVPLREDSNYKFAIKVNKTPQDKKFSKYKLRQII